MSKGTIGFDGQVVVVTNGSHGCGKGLASSFAARGASVFIHDEDVKAANAIAESIRQSGGTATACRSGSAQGDVAVDEALEQYGAVHVLINNMTPNSSAVRKFGDLPVGEWDAFMKVLLCHPRMQVPDGKQELTRLRNTTLALIRLVAWFTCIKPSLHEGEKMANRGLISCIST